MIPMGRKTDNPWPSDKVVGYTIGVSALINIIKKVWYVCRKVSVWLHASRPSK